MKKNLFTILALTGSLVMLSTSCSKKIDEAYQNPNVDVKVAPEKLLPSMESCFWANSSSASNGEGHGPAHDSRYIGQYIQNWVWSGVSSNFDRMGYTNSAADVSQSFWRTHYYDLGQNNVRMMQWATEDKKWDYVGVGKALFAWSWLTLTDLYGDVILDEAFNTGLLTFKYNTQDQVYEHVRKLCFESLTYLDMTGDGVGKLAEGDAFFFNGDVNKWKKFVYGILARYHNHLSNKSTYKPDSVIFYARKAMTTNADNGMIKYTATPIFATNNYFGPLRARFAGTGDGTNPTSIRQSTFIVNLLTGKNNTFLNVNDPRDFYLLRLNTAKTYRGVDPIRGQTVITANERPENFWGGSQASAVTTTAGAETGIRHIWRNASPIPVLTASEMQFLIAEAAFRMGDKPQAYTAYKNAIALNFDMLMETYSVNIPADSLITAAKRDAYINDPKVSGTDASTLTMSQIMLQKYIAMWGYGALETWGDMRRYHYTDAYPAGSGTQVYTDFVVPSSTTTDLFRPDNGGRLVYRIRPRFNSEYVWNINELSRIGATSIDYHTKECWFSLP